MTKRILYVHRGLKAARPSFADRLEQSGCAVEVCAIAETARLKGSGAVFAIRNINRFDLIIASEYHLVWALAVKLLLSRSRAPLIALGFNKSSRSISSGSDRIDRWVSRIWRRVALFIVHSRSEATLFTQTHGIPVEKFMFSHWGYDLPTFDVGKFVSPYAQYVSMIGRNNRDIALFYETVSRCGTNGVLVTSAYMMTPELRASKPASVTILIDISMDLCLDIVRQSSAHLILVKDDQRGAGHISAVSAMLLEKPQVFSAVATLDDYLIDGFNGLAAPLGDAARTAEAVTALLSDPPLAEALGRRGYTLATEWMSADVTAARIADQIIALLNSKPLPASTWADVRDDLAARNN